MKGSLILLSVFTVGAGTWLAVMENVLKHDGYPMRTVIDICIALQGLATLLGLRFPSGFVLRLIVVLGALAIGYIGAMNVFHILRAPHFEGFVLVIGAALIVQGILTLATLARKQYFPG